MKLSRRFYIPSLILFASGCGGSSDGNSAKEFSQNVDKVPYSLGSVEISATLGTATSDSAENLHKSIGEVGRSKDQVLRVIKGSSFVLIINGKESSVQVSSAGNINHQQTIAENGPGCELHGVSQVNGVSTSLKFELTWDFSAELSGDGCDDVMTAKYYNFQENELNVFNLSSVRSVLDSADTTHEAQRKIHIQLSLAGDSHS